MSYINHFNEDTGHYLQFRPDYPTNMYQFLVSLVDERHLAWDCGTGNGQAAFALAHYFQQVIATDINQKQLAVAPKKENIRYECWPAEKTQLENSSVDLITVAQALHWFHFESFYAEVRRVAKPNALLAAWCYALINVNTPIDAVIQKLYHEILGNHYWPRERDYIDEAYKTIPFPFAKLPTPHFQIEKRISFEQLLGYLNTWSAVKEYAKRNGKNPVSLIFTELKTAWGNHEKKPVSWPIHLLIGRINEINN